MLTFRGSQGGKPACGNDKSGKEPFTGTKKNKRLKGGDDILESSGHLRYQKLEIAINRTLDLLPEGNAGGARNASAQEKKTKEEGSKRRKKNPLTGVQGGGKSVNPRCRGKFRKENGKNKSGRRYIKREGEKRLREGARSRKSLRGAKPVHYGPKEPARHFAQSNGGKYETQRGQIRWTQAESIRAGRPACGGKLGRRSQEIRK